MLQRAASNAYSWWWAGHVRTKQSKWLEQNLQDMGEKVQSVLKLIEEDGDSFAKRAEMYYKKRPELIYFVEESYRAYRALAERYDHLSTELQHANSTLATVFPDQFQYSTDDEDEDSIHRLPRKPPSTTEMPKNIPRAPKDLRDLKGTISVAPKQPQKLKHSLISTTFAKSGLSKPQGLQEIDKLQKEILGLQTEKEFVKSSYENGLAKFWEIEEQIREKHNRISKLQDEFGEGMTIEDNEARSLMATAALKSCNERLVDLKTKHDEVSGEAKTEKKRIRDFWEKLSSLKECPPGQIDRKEPRAEAESPKCRDKSKISDERESSAALVKHNPDSAEVESTNCRDKKKISEQEESSATVVKHDLNQLREKIKDSFEAEPKTSITVTEMVETVDEIVNKAINLESTVSSQPAFVKRLKTENDELQTQIQELEDDKGALIEDATNMSKKLREMEEKFQQIQELNRKLEEQNKHFQIEYTKAHCNLEHLSKKLPNMKPDEDLEIIGPLKSEDMYLVAVNIEKEREHKGTLISEGDLNNLQSEEQKEDLGAKVETTTVVVNSEGKHKGQEDKAVLDPGIRKDEELKCVDRSGKKEGSSVGVESQQESEKHEISSLSSSSGKERDISVTFPEDCGERKMQDKADENASSAKAHDLLNTQEQKRETGEEEEESDCQQLSTNGVNNKEILVDEYTTLLQNYDNAKIKLTDVENKSRDDNLEEQIRELKSKNAMKDEEIQVLRQKLNLVQRFLDENQDMKNTIPLQKPYLLDDSLTSKSQTTSARKKEESKVKKVFPGDQSKSVSSIEEKFQTSIDELLEQSLSFLVKFSTSLNQIQKFESEVQDLQAELSKIEERVKDMEETSPERYNYVSDVRPIYKHLQEIHTQLTVWLERSILLTDELKTRFSFLCDTQEDIEKVFGGGSGNDDFRFTSDQAAKFQGEILIMKQENTKVTNELQVCIDQMTTLQHEVEKTLAKLDDEFKFSGPKKVLNPQTGQSEIRHRVPLRSFIFGDKPKKQKPSFFSCVSPMFFKKHNDRKDSF